ncbi:hypothetical protein FNF27_05469 [Cafeteria roenbergensis]|uniref:Cadherin domain-containing protein n=1 Tax=Cafeteria roenbergensis TaxID=33653 RepID=A0A5A8E6M5_CAFRO|nr:hypothetical protein FNF27_05469 [Cafeteria roenbergensis]
MAAKLQGGATGTIVYSITSQSWNQGCVHGDSNVFTISSLGQLSLNSRSIKYDTCTSFVVNVRTSFGASVADCKVTISVVDVNEKPTALCGNREVNEKVIAGTKVGLPMLATDPDRQQALIWTITSPTSSPFSIAPCDGQVLVRNGGAALDATEKSSYSLTLAVTDDGEPKLSATCSIVVTVRNVNEPPSMTSPRFVFGLFENMPAATVAGTVTATDPDADRLVYAWAATDSPDHFALDSQTGKVSIRPGASINFEAKDKYTYTAKVSDPSDNVAQAQVVINIADDADAPTILDVSAMSVPELAAANTLVGRPLTAKDEDANDQLTWSVTSGSAFGINPQTGQLFVSGTGGASLNFEAATTAIVAVQVTDSHSLTAFKSITVDVTNVNEAPTMSPLTRSVKENAAIGVGVGGAVAAQDVDAGTIISYSLVSNPGAFFSIESGGGQIRVAKSLDFETKPVHTLTVRATDNGSPPKFCEAQVTINVEDTTEPPTIAAQSVTVREDAAVGSRVLAVVVQDEDAGDTHTCTITEGNIGSMFALKPVSGSTSSFHCEVIVGTGGLDFEKASKVVLKVTAADSADPPNSGSGLVTVSVTDVNEAPVITDSSAGRAVSALALKGSPIGSPLAFGDPDVGQSHAWQILSITAPDDVQHNSLFTIDNNGQFRVGVDELSVYIEVHNVGLDDPDCVVVAKVTDNGTPPMSGEVSTKIQIVSGNKPPTVMPMTLSVEESTLPGSIIGKAVATDPEDQLVNKFAISAGNEQGLFSINEDTGEIKLLGKLDFEGTSSFTLQVQAQDNPPNKIFQGEEITVLAFTATAVVSVKVLDVNEAPVLLGGDAAVDELSPRGVKVGMPFFVSDPDAGDKPTFAISKGNTGSVFGVQAVQDALGKWGGQIVVEKASLNFEVMESYNLELQATDKGGLKSAASVLVTVNNVNDPPTIGNLQTLVLAENTAVGSLLPASGVLVPVLDEDHDAVSLRIKSGGEGLFKLSPSGQLSLAGALDFETKDRHVLTIEAQDVRQAAATKDWVIQVSNVWEKPVYSGPAFAQVTENAKVGSLVLQCSCDDQDLNDELVFSFAKDSSVFGMGSSNGQIRVVGSVNYEDADSHQLTVVCTDREGLSASATVSVKVTDVNEAPAIVTASLDLPETEASGAAVGRIVIADQDASDTHSVTITSGNGPADAPHFVLDGSTLKLANAALDFEGESGATSFTLGIKVVDSGTPPLSASANVRVVVLDRNEPPVMLDQARSIEENSLTSAPVGAPLEASDPDQGQLLTFRITAGNEDGKFKIDPCSGQIKVDEDKGLDFETKSSYTLTVQVQDDGAAEPGPARLADTATVTISVIDVNEPPTLQDAAASIAENSAQGTPISVASSAALDFESVKAFTLRVRATDDGKPKGPALFGEADVVVSVLDVNEPPVFLAQQRSILENSAAGSAIGARLDASDPDAEQTVSFELSGGPDAASFTLSSNGQLTSSIAASFDFESKAEYAVEVTARDSATPSLQTKATIVVNVLNQNEAPTMPDATVEIAESAGVGATVPGTASLATDPDAGDRLQYELVKQEPDRPIFRVLAADGSVEVKSALLDFETVPVHRVWVRVTDIDGLADEGVITIEVQDVNEPPTLFAQARAVYENAPGAPVGEPLIASDPDADDKGALTFSLLSGGAATQFAINSTSGQLSTAAGSALDHESAELVVLSVQVEDTQGLTSTAQVSVTVRDVNEAPSMAEDTFEFKVAENAVMGTQIDFVSAADVDDGDVLTWSMRVVSTGTMAAAGAGDFAINPATGALTVAKDTGLATDPPGTRLSKYLPEGNVYTLQVTVTDDGTGLLQDTATVRVTVIENNDPPELEAEYSASVSENCAANTLALELQATEYDEKDRNKLTYAILDGNYADTFKLTTVVSTDGSSNKAELRVARPIIDFEDRTSYSLVVQVSDGFLKASTVVTVSVVGVNERPIIDAASLTMAVDENPASVGGVVGTVVARDVDADDLLTFAFFGDGNKAGHFAIDASTGAVSVASLDIDRETTSSYSIGVRVSDAGGLVDERQLSVLVNDVNDAPVLGVSAVTVAENSPRGTVVSVGIRAKDQDTSDAVSYSMGRPNCWGVQMSKPGAREYSPFVVKPVGAVRSVDFSVKAATGAVIVMRDHAEGDAEYAPPTGPSYELTLGLGGTGSGASLRRVSVTTGGGVEILDLAPTASAAAGLLLVHTRGNTRLVLEIDASDTGRRVVTLARATGSDAVIAQWVDETENGPVGMRFGVGASSAQAPVQVSPACFEPLAASSSADAFKVSRDGNILVSDVSTNFEAQREFGFELIATDDGTPSLSSSAAVVIQVSDVNEVMSWATVPCPNTTGSFIACFSVPENTLTASSAATLGSVRAQASDPDVLAGQTLSFTVGPVGNSANDKAVFAVGATSGVVSLLQNALNFEAKAAWEVGITATDNGVPSLSKEGKVHIAVEDVNEPPALLTESLSVSETAGAGSQVGSALVITDPDPMDSHVVSIVGGNGPSEDWFRIDGTKVVLGAAPLDFEGVSGSNRFSLQLRVSDVPPAGKLPGTLAVTKTVVVSVTDANERPVIADAERQVEENSPVNTPVGDILPASDQDAGQTLSFAITSGNDDGMFKIDGCSGQVKVARAALDFETTKEYSLQVTVTDDGGVVPGPARLSASAVLTIRIVDVNEPPSLKDSAATVDENSAVGTAVGSALRGEDVDAGSVLSYAIASGNVGQVLALDSSSGVLSVQRAAIDFETTAKYVLNVTVTDNGKPSGPPLSSWGIVTVTVRDINEAPVIEDQQRSVNENSLAGQLVGSLLAASDVDAGNSLTFAIVGGQDAAAFLVSPVGQLTVATGARSTSRPGASSSSRSESQTLTRSAPSSRARDVDADDVLSYAIVSQSPGSFFRMLSADGAVEVRQAGIDFETSAKHSLLVRVTDKAGLSAESQLHISVADVNEAPVIADQRRSVPENSPSTSCGLPLVATDVDAKDTPYSSPFAFSIVSSSAPGAFAIDPTSGVLSTTAAAELDHEAAPEAVVRVRVTDSSGATGEAAITVLVTDVNEAPTFAHKSYSFQVAENAKFQEEVDIVSAADPDKADTLRFTLRVDSAPEGGQASDLGINPSTGKVFVARKTAAAVATPSEYLPQGGVYTCTATAQDNGIGGLMATTQVVVSVVPYNDPPTLPASVFGSVRELAAANTLVATIEGSDNDQDNELSYTILDGNYADTFKLTTVASASGHNFAELRVARPIIDFEDRTSYSLVVQVSDGFLKASTVVTVSVVGVNERPIIDAASLTMAVDENPASVGGVVGTVVARDVDADDLLTFAFFGDGNKAGHFAIDASTGAVSVASLDIDRETTSSYSIGVRVSDAGGLVDERQLSVLVNDVNDAPALADVVLQVPENLAPGAQVSSPLRVVDDDARDRHTFKMGRPNCWASQASTIGKYYFAPLAVKPSGSVQLGGAVRVRGAAQARIALSVMAPTDELYKAPTGFFYQLTVGALNNAHSTIEKCSPSCFQVASAPTPAALSTREFRSFWFSVSSQGLVTLGRGESEQLSEGLLVSFQDGADAAHGPALLPTRVGVAAASSALQFSSLCFDTAQSGAEGVFAVVEDGSVRIAAASPDFEAQREFGFEVLVTDSGDPAKQAAGVVMVQVQDVNERVTWTTSSCLPGSAQAFAACLTVAENTLPGSAAAVLQSIAGMATDPDTLAKQALTFSVALDGNSFEGAKLFDVAPSTGVLSVKQDGLNHEQAAEWTLVVTATDNGTPQLSASALVHVAVEDVNEAPSLAAVVRTVAENSATGEVLVGGPILGSDVDAGQWGELAYAITGGSGSSVFGIEPSSGSLRVLNGTAGDLNFESLEKSKYQLVVRATDGGGLTARATVTVDVTDVNEAPVLFDAVRSVRENTLAPGKVGAPVTGTDPDNAHPVLGVRQQLLYSIVGGDGVALFKVDPCSGQLEVRDEASLNFEAKPAYTLTLQARDDVQPTPLTATATVTISLVDANDAPSIVVPPGGYVLQVEELAPVGTVLVSASGLVDRISATDEDVASATADWARLRWSLKSGNSLGIFDIDAVTGQVSVADFGRMDFENKDLNAFSLVAQVCDSGAPALCAETPVRVEVLNSNEPPRLEDASRAVNENTLSEAKLVAGQQLGLDLVASDPDGPSDEAKLRWRIESGDSLGFFSISEAGRAGSLVLTAAGAMGLNHEVVDSYTLVVSVTDAGGLSDTATVTVAVADLNERPILAAATFSINENSPRLSVVAGSASLATDEDADDSHTYEVVNQVPAGVFRVANARTGQLEVDEAVLDFEAVQSHRITMRVTDAGKLSAPDAVWTVNILDVQEPPSVVAAAFEGLPENSAAGVHVGTVKASDPDADDAGKLVFSITSQEENEDGVAPFAIDPSSGSLRVAESPTSEPVRLDFEGKNLFALTVSATDSKGNSASAAVTVRLSNVNEPPMLRENGTAIAAMENTVQDIRSIMDLVRDPDAGDAFRFEILSGDRCSSGAKVIKIDASTGVLSMVALGTCTQTYDPSTPQFKPNDVDFDNKFDLMIRITDSHLASTVNHLVIKLSGSNGRPRFVSRTEPFLLDENSAVGTLVGTVFAVDLNYQKQSLEYAVGPRGANVNRPFPFKMVTREATEQDRMALAQSDAGASVQLRQVGEILVDGPIDFEGEFSTYQMVVVATDSDSNLPLTGSMDVTVGVVNLNEPPTFVDGAVGGSAMFVVTVPENSVLGTALAGDKLVATDVDSADQGSVLRYSLEGEQAAVDLFQVDPISGAMVFKGSPTALNFENVAARAFELTAVVTDSASNAVRRPVQVRVLDVNEPPRFVGTSAFFFNVLEGSKFGTLVGSCAAVDDDAPTSARGQLRFSIAATDGTPSDDSALFEISQAGKLTVKQESLDWENQAEYSFVVTVTDGDADSPLSASRPVLVIVRDVNDISVDSFAALPADVAGGVAWDVDVDPATAAVPNMYNGEVVDWRATHSTMDALSDAYTRYEVTYGPVRGTKYAATNCSRFGGQSAPNTAIVCSTSEGAGVNHIWRVTVVYDDLSDVLPFSRTSSAKTGFAPPGRQSSEVFTQLARLFAPTISRVSQLVLATQGGDEVTLFGDNFGPIGTAPSSLSTTTTSRLAVLP